MREQDEVVAERPTSPGLFISVCRLNVDNNCVGSSLEFVEPPNWSQP